MTDWWRAATGQTLEQIEEQIDQVDSAREQFADRLLTILEHESLIPLRTQSIDQMVRCALGDDLQIIHKQTE